MITEAVVQFYTGNAKSKWCPIYPTNFTEIIVDTFFSKGFDLPVQS